MSSTEQPASGGFGLMDAAQQLEGILASEAGENEDNSNSEEVSKKANPEAEADGEVAASEEEETSAEEAETDDEATEEPEDSDDEQSEREPMLTVKIDGKEQQITAKEAAAGYMRTQDYTRKTQEVSEQRKQIEAQQQYIQQQAQVYGQLIPALQQQIVQLTPQEPDWERLHTEDPLEYLRQKDIWRERNDKLTALQAEQQRLAQEQQAQQAQQRQQILTQGREILFEKNPQWKDIKRWNADVEKMMATAVAEGFQPEELSNIYDPRTIGILRKAAAYDELMAKKPQPTPGKVIKSAPAGSSAHVPKPRSEVTRAKQRLAKSGRVADAAALFESFIE